MPRFSRTRIVKPTTSKSLHWVTYAAPVLLFALLIAFAEYIVGIEQERLEASERSRILLQASALRARIETELNATLHIATGLAGYVAINPALENKPQVQKILRTLFERGNHLRNIGLAPDNILTYVYPVAGNEKAVGLHYEANPEQWPAVRRAMQSRSTIMDGPIALVQGGEGLVSRTPVYLDDGSYWGILSMVINVDALRASFKSMTRDSGIRFALRSKDGVRGRERLLLGDTDWFAQDPVLLDLSVPGDQWQLAVIPETGWGSTLSHLGYYRAGAVAVSLILAIMLWVIAAERRAIAHIALHDPLTGLANRRLFEKRLDAHFTQSQRKRTTFALLSIDLNNFKPVNDQYGHKAGDEVLCEVARRFRANLPEADTVARCGGDEFLLILPAAKSRQEAREVAEKLRQLLSRPFSYLDHTLKIDASIGVGLYPQDGTTPDALLKAADSAMYEEKRASRARRESTGECA